MLSVQYIDYGVGNKKSVINALDKLGKKVLLITKIEDLDPSLPIILPGVGSFLHCHNELVRLGFFDPLNKMLKKGEIKKLIGICVGMQLLFKTGYEDGETNGFGVFDGKVNSLKTIPFSGEAGLVPNISWCNTMHSNSKKQIGKFYFVHSFANCNSKHQVAFYNWHGQKVTAVARKGGIWGVQFHPEKSAQEGLLFLDKLITLDPKEVI